MRLGEVIRKYRKENNMTQEEVATRLGVSAPAVNKWENGNSYPDIMLLAPIARMFGITTDTLLSYQEELTNEEITAIIYEADAMLKEKPFEECFEWMKKKAEQYPNCEWLVWQIAVILDAQRMIQEIPESEEQEAYCYSLYLRTLESKDANLRSRAADSLFGYHMRKKQYDKAEPYLEYFPIESSERKMKKARLFAETGRTEEAYKAYEDLLYANYMVCSAAMSGIYMLALKDDNTEKAKQLVEKQTELAKRFEMGKYYEVSCQLEIATMEKDVDTVIAVAKEMLDNADGIYGFCKSSLYEHMEFKEARQEFIADMKENLRKCFREEERYGFLKDDKRWQELMK